MSSPKHSVLILDIGSSSVRAMLYDETAQPILGASSIRSYSFEHPENGAAVTDAKTLRGLVETCIDDLMTHHHMAGVMAVGAAAFADSLVGLDEMGTPITPVYSYADMRAAATLDGLRAQFDAEAVHQRTGCVLHPAHRPAKLAWLRALDPAAFAQVAEWVDFPSYLYRAWLGEARCSFSLASWSGLLDRHRLVWDKPLLEAVGVGLDQLPILSDIDEPMHGLRGVYRDRWAALANVPFYPAVGDGAAANVGAGAIGDDRVALTLGTTGALRKIFASSEAPPLRTGLFGYRVDAHHHLIGGASNEGGNIYAWAYRTLMLPHDADEQLRSRSVDAHGLTVLPLLAGERSPGYALHATGVIEGLQLDTSPLDILQAVMESVALRLSLIYDQVDPMGTAAVYAGGGALRQSESWRQLIADALNRPIYMVSGVEGTMRGAAILTLCALRGESISDTAMLSLPAQTITVVRPRPHAAAALARARDRQEKLYQQVIG